MLDTTSMQTSGKDPTPEQILPADRQNHVSAHSFHITSLQSPLGGKVMWQRRAYSFAETSLA